MVKEMVMYTTYTRMSRRFDTFIRRADTMTRKIRNFACYLALAGKTRQEKGVHNHGIAF
jgi:hypothetical protein